MRMFDSIRHVYADKLLLNLNYQYESNSQCFFSKLSFQFQFQFRFQTWCDLEVKAFNISLKLS